MSRQPVRDAASVASRVSPGDAFAARLTPRQQTLLAVFLSCFVIYLVVFVACEVPSYYAPSIMRGKILSFLVLTPERMVQGWFGLGMSFHVWDRLPILGVASSILGFACILGWVLLRTLRLDRGLFRAERFVFSVGLGLNTVSLYVLAIGLAGQLVNLAWFFVPAALVLAVAAWYALRGPEPAGEASGVSAPPSEEDWLNRHWLWLGVPFALAILLAGMLPPVDFDVREYHLEAPKEFFLAGRIGFLPHNVYGNMAMGSEMLCLLGMVLTGDWWLGALVGKTLIAMIAPLTAWALVAAGRRFFSVSAGIVAALVYISVPWVSAVSTSGLVEGVSAFYLLLAVYAALLWQRSNVPADGVRHLALAGLMTGAAIACKYPAALFVALPLAAWTAWASGRQACRNVGVFSLAVVVACGLWFGKNWALTGNPTYPLLYKYFAGETRTDAKNEQWREAHDADGFTLEHLGESLELVGWKSDWHSPLLLPLAALGLLATKHRRLALGLCAFLCYVLISWWLVTHRVDRFLVPTLPIVALLAGLGATCMAARAWQRTVLGILVLGLGMNFLFVVGGHGTFPAFFAPLAQLRYSPACLEPWHDVLNRTVPPHRKVLLVGDAEPFDLKVPVVYNTVFDDCVFEQLCQNRSPEEIRFELLRRGISQVYVDWWHIDRYRRPGNYGFPASIQPELFDRLVAERVLAPPMRFYLLPKREAYVVLNRLPTETAQDGPTVVPASANR